MGTRNDTVERKQRRRAALVGRRKTDSRERSVAAVSATSNRDELQLLAAHGNYHVRHAALYKHKLRDEQYLAAYGVIRGLRAL